MDLKHVVITAVARDDLKDGGAAVFAETVRAIRRKIHLRRIEVITFRYGRERRKFKNVNGCKTRYFKP